MKKKKSLQLNLDTFLLTNNKRKQVFYIDWDAPRPRATWLISKPKEISFSSTVKWSKIGDIIVCCKNKASIKEDENSLVSKNLEKINSSLFDEQKQLLSFIKSHLQKSIRRQKVREALLSSKELLILEKNEFLRRICIIMFEDVKLKSYFVNFVWLMVACSKGYVLEEYHIDSIFKYVYDMAVENECEQFGEEETKNEKIQLDKFIDRVNMNKNISEEKKDILYCIGLRISYGGMNWDMEMLWNYANKYYHFFEKEENDVKELDPDSCKDINAKYVFGMNFEKVEDFVYQGADFHCFPVILKSIKEKTNNKYSEEQLKSCIWEFSSKINTRKNNDVEENSENLKGIWDDIKQPLMQSQKIMVKMMLNKLKEI